VPTPVLLTIRLVPFKSRELRQEHHEVSTSVLYMTNIYIQRRKSRGTLPDKLCAGRFNGWRGGWLDTWFDFPPA
jgi:hypothetical protein